MPVKLVHRARTTITSQEDLIKENQRLRAEQMLLKLRVQKITALETENKQLRALLASSNVLENKASTVQLISVASDPAKQEIVIDQGQKQHLKLGQPVLDAYGVFGQVVEVDPMTSRVMLISDRRSAVPVENNRTGVRGIVEGTGFVGNLLLVNVPKTADVRVGDLLVSSGLGHVYPMGYPVGTVVSVTTVPGEHFAQIDVAPSAHLDRTRLMLLLWG